MSRAIQLAPDVYRIPTLGSSVINSFAFVGRDGDVTLVDAGLKGRAPRRIEAALAEIGKAPTDVSRIILTHAHYDHAGGVKGLHDLTGAAVTAHVDDAKYVSDGEPPPPDPSSITARILAFLPGGSWDGIGVDEEVADGELLDIAGGIRVVHTPGHTPGHISLVHEPSGTLITGDAMVNWRHRTRLAIRFFCTDIAMSRETVWRLGDVDYEVAAFTHGPEIADNARDRIKAFLASKLRGQA